MEKAYAGIAGSAYVATERLFVVAVVKYPVLGMDTTYRAITWRWHWMSCLEVGADTVLHPVASLAAVPRSAVTTIGFDELMHRLELPAVLALFSGNQPMTVRFYIRNPVCT